MPTIKAAKAANATYQPAYVPVAVFAGGTSGIGTAMAEALARYTGGRAHIVLIGQNEVAAAHILSGLPKPPDDEGGWRHEFVRCDASEMANIREVCADLRKRLVRINYLVLSAGANTMMWAGETSEGLDWHLSLRYYSRFVYIQELASLLAASAELGQDARVMSVLGAGFNFPPPTEDLNNVRARARSWKWLQGKGLLPCVAALRGMYISGGLNDAMVVWFAAKYPQLAFTHIHPGMVRTPGSNAALADLGWLLAPLSFALRRLINFFVAVEQDTCAEWMLHALLDPARVHGAFFVNRHGDVLSSCEGGLGESSQKGFVNGVPMKGYAGSDAVVRLVCGYAEEVTRATK
ncbi:hypothetical protein B0H10DRAFT_1924381 [Mycena sp. CBHHK59/15]|nr:hypothetical protein B0H10DRAFT_1924381 [Mycena sp. CBHHK59/15]